MQKSNISATHEEWIRKKDHEDKLRKQLILEAKKDMLENERKKFETELQKKEEWELLLYEWDRRKREQEFQNKQKVSSKLFTFKSFIFCDW